MTERPILFSAPMVRALLDGSKTQTRRVVKDSSASGFSVDFQNTQAFQDKVTPFCPYGKPGDRLWVRETYADVGCRLTYRADHDDGAHCQVKKWTPAIHMFRVDSRILLEVISVRVELLRGISEADVLAEGVKRDGAGGHFIDGGDVRYAAAVGAPASNAFSALWDGINGTGSWDADPWVWVVEFKRVAP